MVSVYNFEQRNVLKPYMKTVVCLSLKKANYRLKMLSCVKQLYARL